MNEMGKRLAICGVVLQFGSVIGIIGTVMGMLLAFAELSNGEPEVGALASRISFALYAQASGLLLSLGGVILLCVALFGSRYRASWFRTAMWVLAILWLFSIPIGTVVGVIVMVYLSKHKEEFIEPTERPLSSEPAPCPSSDEVSS